MTLHIVLVFINRHDFQLLCFLIPLSLFLTDCLPKLEKPVYPTIYPERKGNGAISFQRV